MDTLRRASSTDAGKVEALVDRAYRHYIERIGRKPRPMLADHGAAIADHEVWVVEREGALVGTLELIHQPDHLFIENLAVDPVAQGAGLGRQLLDLAESRAREMGQHEIRLWTNSRFTENRAMYAHLGYRESGEIPTETTPIVTFAKRLAPVTRLDHVVIGAGDLAAGSAWLGRALGLEVQGGGRHPDWGTHNALVPLADQRYLEVLAPDPSATDIDDPRRWAALAALDTPTPWTWAISTTDLDATVAAAHAAGLPMEAPVERSRQRPDGSVVRWRLAFPVATSRLVPFAIEWGAGVVHPSAGGVARLASVEFTTPQASNAEVLHSIAALGLDAAAEHVIVRAGETEAMRVAVEVDGRVAILD